DAIRLLALDDIDTGALAETLGGLLGFDQPPSVQAAAIDALGRLQATIVADVILKSWPGFSPRLRTQAVDVLLSRSRWTVKTLQALQAGRIAGSEISST
ncbi:MAG: hypothetical protein ABGZ17_19110, partial [Planctomycetaceae bacterium]